MTIHSDDTRQRLAHLVPWGLFALALAARFYGLVYHSLWFDEVMSTYWAARPAGEIIRVGLTLTEDKHPPLYYLMLHGWTALFGPGDYAVRALGALLGALAVWPVYGIGRLLGGRRSGVIAALLLALNPFLIWYSQEARMFMPSTTFALVGLYGLLRAWPALQVASRPRTGWKAISRAAAPWLALLVLGLSAALYTYLYSAFLLPVAGAWLLLMWWQARAPGRLPISGGISGGRPAGSFWAVAGALAGVALLFLPLARAAWLVSGAEAVPGHAFAGMFPALRTLLGVYTVNRPAWAPPWITITTIGAGLLALAGLLWPGRDEDGPTARSGGLYCALWMGLVIICGGILLSRDGRVFAETRYQIVLVPALCLGWGRALAALWQWRRPAGRAALALAVGVTLVALPADWTPANRRENWRDAAAFVATHAGPGDAVLIQADYVHLAFERYFKGAQPVYFPFTKQVTTQAQVDPPLAGLYGFDAVWLVQSHHEPLDPQNLIAGWFGARYPEITEAYPAGIVIHGFLQKYRMFKLPRGVASREDLLGDIRLLGCAHDPATLAPRDDRLHPPSNWIHVTSYWSPERSVTTDLLPTIRLVDAQGQVWGEKLDRPGDAAHIWPTSHWQKDELVRLDYDVNLNPLTPPGSYRLAVSVPGVQAEASCGEVTIAR